MKNKKIFLTTIVFLFGTIFTFAQTVDIKGTVRDEAGDILPGVSIVIEGTTQGAITRPDGTFSIKANIGQKLIFSFVGMISSEVVVTSAEMDINVILKPASQLMEEVVVVGYGVQKRESVVGAIATADVGAIKEQGNISNMTDALNGKIPGVSILQMSGMPGGNLDQGGVGYQESQILIRGRSTWNNASPLVLVDGVERDMNDIDISEIKSISVLKDASATAVFGVKGGNGVILITTNRGREGKASLSIETNTTFERPSRIMQSADSYNAFKARNYGIERARMANSSSNWNEYVDDRILEYYRTNQLPYVYTDNNWSDIMFDNFAWSNRVNMNLTGGTKFVTYFTSLTYNRIGDILSSADVGQGYNPEFKYDRYNFRTNFDFKISKTTTVSVNLFGVYGVQQRSQADPWSMYIGLDKHPSDAPVLQYEDGIYGMQYKPYDIYGNNPYAQMQFSGLQRNPQTQITADYTVRQDLDFITKGLKLSSKIAYDNTFYNRGLRINDAGMVYKQIDEQFYLQGGFYDEDLGMYVLNGEAADMSQFTKYSTEDISTTGFEYVKGPNSYESEKVGNLDRTYRNIYYEIKLDYARRFGAHNVGALAMFSRQKTEYGSDWPSKREDWVGRITYDYGERYFLEINGAYNGSEKFGPAYRFDFFPSLAAGWAISNEGFIKKSSLNWIELLKFRVSYGVVGNDRVVSTIWPYLTIWDTREIGEFIRPWENRFYAPQFGYPFSSGIYPNYLEGTPGNPDLHWEIANKLNYGIDFSAYRGKVVFNLDIFSEKRDDMLIGKQERANNVPEMAGIDPPAANIGKTESKGAELQLILRNNHGNSYNYWTSLNWSVARSKVIYRETPDLTPFYQKPEGYPIGQGWSTNAYDFAESWDDIYCYPGSYTEKGRKDAMPGDFLMFDYDADGVFNAETDAVPYGYPNYPQNNYGFAFGGGYKGLELAVRFTGVYNITRTVNPTLFHYQSSFIPTYVLEETWTPEYGNEDPGFPPITYGKNYNIANANKFDGSILRLQTIQISYKFPSQWTKRLKLEQIRIFANGNNLFLWSKLPEDAVGIGYQQQNYPSKKQVTFGLNIKL